MRREVSRGSNGLSLGDDVLEGFVREVWEITASGDTAAVTVCASGSGEWATERWGATESVMREHGD